MIILSVDNKMVTLMVLLAMDNKIRYFVVLLCMDNKFAIFADCNLELWKCYRDAIMLI